MYKETKIVAAIVAGVTVFTLLFAGLAAIYFPTDAPEDLTDMKVGDYARYDISYYKVDMNNNSVTVSGQITLAAIDVNVYSIDFKYVEDSGDEHDEGVVNNTYTHEEFIDVLKGSYDVETTFTSLSIVFMSDMDEIRETYGGYVSDRSISTPMGERNVVDISINMSSEVFSIGFHMVLSTYGTTYLLYQYMNISNGYETYMLIMYCNIVDTNMHL